MVFYRKYRPQKIDDLDSVEVRETLTSILKKEPSHAFLFTGPKGLGKTSSARIIAKVVNCTTSPKKRKNGFEPCDECEACISIVNSSNMDILEIDAASNRGIDEIRDLKEKIRLSPITAKIKVYIIDEVHMLTTEAFNALLKTLEEPPAHAMFVLCTTEPQKVPATIISRCFHISFRKATDDELVRSFLRIAKGENISIDKETLNYIAKLSDGSFRDGTKILEEMSLHAAPENTKRKSKSITRELVEKKYQMISINKHVENMLIFLKGRNTKKALFLVSELIEQGVDIKYFTQSLIENLHEELLAKIQTGKPESLESDSSSNKILIELLSKAYTDMKFAVILQLPLELAIIDFTQINTDQRMYLHEEIGQTGQVSSINDLRKQAGNIKKIKAMYGSEKQAAKKNEYIKENNDAKVTLLHTTNGQVSNEWLSLFWNNIISEMKSYNHTIAGVLRGCRISGFDKNSLIIETSYKFHKERLDDVKTMEILTKVTKMLTGKDVKVEVQLKK